ncbi:sensor histidine kinase [Xanthomonas theicola]|uniref:histidine kinase n=1 Tax=Xanthomonas theicola TaxID=56464 RepID=A0A2S6ZEB9_9XANT|nr:HAMP domain-containing sensor histidine kinase [Xanthomonas theicola]PPT90516.1 two-component sensor histidine kinase [Xanthomonas theicola]QNH26836.1 HAMP domain-containing histidine kinase [Xanthomonas theicola]
MPHGLPRKIRLALIARIVFAGCVVALGSYLVVAVVQHSLVGSVMRQEATHYWRLYAQSPAQPPPNSHTLRGYLVPAGRLEAAVPAELRGLELGLHEHRPDGEMVLVDETKAGRLYLVFLRAQAQRLAFWFGIVPALLTLIAVVVVGWLTHRASRRLLSPVNWLARHVSQWDPRHPCAADLAPENLPADVQGESRQLAAALHALALRVTGHVSRERNFTRDASHELRTPLTVIRVASDIAMTAPDLPPRLGRSLQRIQRAGRDMEAVIDAFLILAREADVEPQSETFEVADVVEYEAENARELLVAKPVTLTVKVLDAARLHAPPRVLHVVVSNLLRNACNYTDAGSIEVEVAADRIRIRDTGIGMSDDALRRAFEPFFRAEPDRPQGTGLGLSIVRRLCERFGWRIGLESAEGGGTTATVRFDPVG